MFNEDEFFNHSNYLNLEYNGILKHVGDLRTNIDKQGVQYRLREVQAKQTVIELRIELEQLERDKWAADRNEVEL